MPRYKTKELIDALKKTKGMVYIAAKTLGCDPDTILNRARKEPAIAAELKAQRGEVVDTAELKLLQAINDGQPWAIALMLKTQGKDRGYTEKSEVHHSGGTENSNVNVTIEQPPAITEQGRINQVVALFDRIREKVGGDDARPTVDEVHPSPADAPTDGIPPS